MNEISHGEAFWFLEYWRSKKAQLHSLHTNGGGSGDGGLVRITTIDPKLASVSIERVDGPAGQNQEWTLSLEAAAVSLEAAIEPNPIASLLIEFPNGTRWLLTESVISPH